MGGGSISKGTEQDQVGFDRKLSVAKTKNPVSFDLDHDHDLKGSLVTQAQDQWRRPAQFLPAYFSPNSKQKALLYMFTIARSLKLWRLRHRQVTSGIGVREFDFPCVVWRDIYMSISAVVCDELRNTQDTISIPLFGLTSLLLTLVCQPDQALFQRRAHYIAASRLP